MRVCAHMYVCVRVCACMRPFMYACMCMRAKGIDKHLPCAEV